ncbi:MAG: hypothetical protein HOL07_00815 [Rhodospirillaceae bacterium]|mgnify:CR=1 FL=1|nr:hypothetical protein [Rhodospirillaceae bacterium]MBT3931229.1 hypothetical protein [Rhodospirillaceae bacterium]MBT4771561.1 hypothetical protein [Rhodospirillaceae bacterium]MBT5356862.1 hypothetical protein [Rhodospirillaceae bacterium]MBT5770720.1 hypothetical protein [Rhodospirillaceae bacterium]
MSNIEPILLFGAIALIAIQVLRTRLPIQAQSFQILSGVIVGFMLFVGFTDVTAGSLNLMRATHVDEVLAELERNPSEKRLDVLIIGSSRSANAIDDDRLEAALEKAGFPYDVRFIAAGGFFAFEHEALLDEYLRETDRIPIAVLFEVSTEAKVVLDANKENKASGIRFLNGGHAWLAFEHLMESDGPLIEKTRNLQTYARHIFYRMFNIGLAGHAKYRDFLLPRDAYQPFDTPDPDFDPDSVRSALPKDFPVLVARADVLDATLRWRARQAASLPKRGIKNALYFTPPILDVYRRAHQAAICARVPAIRCIEYSDSDLPEQLTNEHWRDAGHVLRSGAEIYTDWLAERLIRKLAGE